MRQYRLIISIPFVMLLLSIASSGAAALSEERQHEIIENYMYVTGQSSEPFRSLNAKSSSLSELPIRCGTPYVHDFRQYYGQLDRGILRASGAVQAARPTLPLSYDTPSGLIRIYYSKTGADAVPNPSADSDGDGIPNYVETVAIVADSVYDYIINRLGYNVPVSDENCPDGVDSKIDVYLADLPAGFFGITFADTSSACGPFTAPFSAISWIVMENDFGALVDYVDRPLDAARVTLAHEFFHIIHFSLDYTESPVLQEMTATWMEEVIYDNIDDYYSIIPFFYDFPGRSLQSLTSLHNNASVVWAIYLEEKFGSPDIIRHVWRRAAELGYGGPEGDYIQAFSEAIDSAAAANFDTLANGDILNFTSAMNEFAVWNYFTGLSASQSPNGIGYSEAANYPMIPIDAMDRQGQFPFTVTAIGNPFNPEVNASTYFRLENVEFVLPSDYPLDIFLSINPLDTFPSEYGVAEIRQLAADPDSHEVFMTVVPSGPLYVPTPIADPSKYRTIIYIFTAASADASFFPPQQTTSTPLVGYVVPDSNDVVITIDSQFVDVPAAILTPYPNPAVIAEMAGSPITFRFQVPTDSKALYQFVNFGVKIDVYTIAGDHVRAIDIPVSIVINERDDSEANEVVYTLEWDMKNQAGKDVSSGVYLAYARMQLNTSIGKIFAEDRVKVVIIR